MTARELAEMMADAAGLPRSVTPVGCVSKFRPDTIWSLYVGRAERALSCGVSPRRVRGLLRRGVKVSRRHERLLSQLLAIASQKYTDELLAELAEELAGF